MKSRVNSGLGEGNSSFGTASMEDRARTRPRALEDTGHGMGALSILMRYLF